MADIPVADITEAARKNWFGWFAGIIERVGQLWMLGNREVQRLKRRVDFYNIFATFSTVGESDRRLFLQTLNTSDMLTLHSFAPIEHANATVLILGSMPGVASLRAGEYYAHPRNYFWRMMGALALLEPESPYEQRVHALKSARIAVWDVLHSCTREGSLDANIDKDSQIPNDFQSFFASHANITRVFFNGSAAEQIYLRNVFPALNLPQIEYLRLPSTSPANASIPFERKLETWKSIVQRD